MEWLTNPEIWIALITLTVLEVVLGIDNVVFITILAEKLPQHQRDRARKAGLVLAMVTRILLLLSIAWIIRLTAPILTVLGQELSGRDLILMAGGLFLLGKATHEIHDRLEGEEGRKSTSGTAAFGAVVTQIMLLDIVFSIDSVVTAVGMVDDVAVMITAVIIAVIVMLVSVGPISTFVERHPTVKMLALSFLILIGVSLIGESLDHHIPKGYIYFAMGFSVFVEVLNVRVRKVTTPVHLRSPYNQETI